MHDDKIRIAVVGAGETGTPLIQQFLNTVFVELAGVADRDHTAPGMSLAEQSGIPVFTDFMDMVERDDTLDFIIDVTGNRNVRDKLRSYMRESGNPETIVMTEMTAILLMSMANGELVKIKHDDIGF